MSRSLNATEEKAFQALSELIDSKSIERVLSHIQKESPFLFSEFEHFVVKDKQAERNEKAKMTRKRNLEESKSEPRLDSELNNGTKLARIERNIENADDEYLLRMLLIELQARNDFTETTDKDMKIPLHVMALLLYDTMLDTSLPVKNPAAFKDALTLMLKARSSGLLDKKNALFRLVKWNPEKDVFNLTSPKRHKHGRYISYYYNGDWAVIGELSSSAFKNLYQQYHMDESALLLEVAK